MKLLECAEILMTIFMARKTLEDARLSPHYFTRNRKMSFQEILRYLISGCKMSTQACLNEFFEKIGKNMHMTQQALSKARNHFDHSPFLKAFYALRDKEYSFVNEDNLKRLYGFLFVAIDDLPALREAFGALKGSASARASIALDVLNDRIIDANLSPLSVDERTLAMGHISILSKLITMEKTVFIFDRGYISKDFIRYLLDINAKFIIRARTKFDMFVDEAKIGSSTVTLDNGITVRVVKFYLPSGEIETLVTNLFTMPKSHFKTLYFLRWPVETKYDIVKNKLELPNFTGYTTNIIYQDFWISMLLSNIASVAKAESDDIIQWKRFGKSNKYQYQTNINVVIASLRNRFALAVFSRNPLLRMMRITKYHVLLYQ